LETCLRADVLPQDIAKEAHVSHQWVYQLRQTLEAFDTASPPPPLSVQGRPRKIHHDVEEGAKEFIEQNLTAYQDEIVKFLASEFDICTPNNGLLVIVKARRNS
jgi:hypothetical protein